MAHFSAYTGQFRANGEAYHHGILRKSIKRNRPRLSCVPCWARKQKCDRRRPCETCVRRSDETACTYEKISRTSEDNGNGSVESQEKLSHIEQLVRQMIEFETVGSRRTESSAMTQLQSGNITPNSGIEGYLHQDSSETRYAGSTHWSAILDSIQELKTAMHVAPSTYADHEDQVDVEIPEGEILFGLSRNYSIQQILSDSLPPKVQVDRRLSAFFKAKILIIPYIHIYQFQRQYQKFWEDPLGVSPLWVSMLFSLCCMAATISEATDSEPSNPQGQPSARAGFLEAAAQCLVLGEFTRPQCHAVEALVLYAQCKYMYSLDPSRELCIILSVVSRIAYIMGYHRDPDNFNSFTSFEGEMRRRAWSACMQFDLMASFQFGLPSNISIDTWDTKPPRNLLDSDFDEEARNLPPSRPQTEPTPILYFVVKQALLNGFTKVCHHALSLATKSKAKVLELDAEVRQMYSTIPDGLRMRPMAQSLADPPFLIITRLYNEFLHQKCLCILHRRQMAQGCEYSTKACIDATMTIITYLIDVNKEFQPGGQLHADRWALSSFIMNDFLLAVMILCLYLCTWKRRKPGKHSDEDPAAHAQLDMLKQSYIVCVEKSAVSKESRRVVPAVKMILAQFETQPSCHTAISTGPSAGLVAAEIFSSDTTASSRGDRITSLSLNEPQPASFTSAGPTSTNNELHPFENIFNNFENVDWTYLTQCLVSSNVYDFNGESDWVNTQHTTQDSHREIR